MSQTSEETKKAELTVLFMIDTKEASSLKVSFNDLTEDQITMIKSFIRQLGETFIEAKEKKEQNV